MIKIARVEKLYKSPGPQPNGLQAAADGLWCIDQGNMNRIKKTADKLHEKMRSDNVDHVSDEAVKKLIDGGRRLNHGKRQSVTS